MRIALTGSSGLIGTALAYRLKADGHEVVAVVRHSPAGHEIGWSIDENRIDADAFSDVDAVVHLAGAGIADHRWTKAYKDELVRSRNVGTRLIGEAVCSAKRPPAVLLSASAVGFYGASPTEQFDESSAAGSGFLAELCQSWEGAAERVSSVGTRVAFMRTGVVLSKDGGALRKQLPLFKLGLGGKMGDGSQWLSWISITDAVGAIVHLLDSEVAGPVNLTAPTPVTNAEFTRALGTALRRPTWLPIPKFGPQLLLGRELAQNLLFTGQQVVPSVLANDGYEFVHQDIASALLGVLPNQVVPNEGDTQ